MAELGTSESLVRATARSLHSAPSIHRAHYRLVVSATVLPAVSWYFPAVRSDFVAEFPEAPLD
jgi:hypothetical protein